MVEEIKLMYVEWVDSGHLNGWQKIAHPEECKVDVTCKSVGWLIHEDDSVVVIAAHLDCLSEERIHNCNSPMTIPICAITKYEEIVF